jgi:hypothetical protein
MNFIDIDIHTVVSGAAAVVGLACLLAIVRLNRTVSHWRVRCANLEAGLPALHREIERYASLSLRTDRQVKRLASDCSNVAGRIDLVEARGAAHVRGPAKARGGAAQALDQAIDHARRGADARRLTVEFGLSRGEADLVARMHGRKTRAS